MQRWFEGRRALLLVLLLPAFDACAEISPFIDRAGDTYESRLQRDSETSSDGSTGGSHDVWTLTERVVALRDGGAELEFDLPADTSAEDRERAWEFPASVFKPAQGPLVLLNGAEAEKRLRSWLGERAQTLCGHWFFGWTAQKIECDPQSVLQVLEAYIEPSGLRDGMSYGESNALGPVPLKMEVRGSNGPIFVARMDINPDAVRRQRAESDVAVAEMTNSPPITFEAALQARAAERVSGTILTTFETDSSARVTRRTRVTQIEISGQNTRVERQTTTETTDWRLTSRSASPSN